MKEKDVNIASLKELRKERNLTQKQLGQLIGVPQEYISTWESGKAKPTPTQMERLVTVLGTSNFTFALPQENLFGEAGFGVFNAKRFGSVLKHARKQAGLPISAVAEKLHLTVPTLSSWENGTHLPSLHAFKELCIFFNISACELLGLIPYEDNNHAFEILLAYAKLNQDGKTEAFKRVSELTEIEYYCAFSKGGSDA